MALTLGLTGPRDTFAKLECDYSDLESGVYSQDEARIRYALINFAISAYHIKDWLQRHKPKAYTAKQVENHVASSVALTSCRDICNAGKHVAITQHEPTTLEVSASITPVSVSTDSPPTSEILRVEIVQKNGSRHEVLELAAQAIRDWQVFFEQHSV